MIAIIPARGGSKGVPGKNIKSLQGKPLIVYTIEAALNAKYIDRIVISTDDEKIAEVCCGYDVDIPFMRPDELAGDKALAIDNYIYTIDRLNEDFDEEIREYAVLLPTLPLRIPEDIDQSIDLFYKKKADSVISCCSLHHPVEWIFHVNQEGLIKRNHDVDVAKMMNRQESRASYIPNGAVFVFKHTLLKEKYSYYSEKTYAFEMPAERSIDIDTFFDFKVVDFLMKESAVDVK